MTAQLSEIADPAPIEVHQDEDQDEDHDEDHDRTERHIPYHLRDTMNELVEQSGGGVVRGGMVPFKGDAAAAARSYLAKDRSVADDGAYPRFVDTGLFTLRAPA